MPVKCLRPGCGQEFDPASNTEASCHFHRGGAVFHEGLKSWSCCTNVNKPVISFDDFLAIPGCTTGSHSADKPASSGIELSEAQKAKAAAGGPSAAPAPVKPEEPQAATYPPRPEHHTINLAAQAEQQQAEASEQKPSGGPFVLKQEIPQDPADAQPAEGASCKRSGCNATFQTGLQRSDDECVFHPGSPIFHEGSKGYACCKPRFLDFESFLAHPGCSKNKHLFVGPPQDAAAEEHITPRTDHYQTPTQVIASFFAKGADKSKSSVTFDFWEVTYDLYLPANKRAVGTIPLHGPVQPDQCTYKIMSTKTEVTLVKADGRSWPTLEYSPGQAQSVLTFGTTGRVGSIGSKDMPATHAVHATD